MSANSQPEPSSLKCKASFLQESAGQTSNEQYKRSGTVRGSTAKDAQQDQATPSVNTDSCSPKENQRASPRPNPEVAEINFGVDPLLLEGWKADIHPVDLFCLFSKDSPYNLAQDLDVDQIQPVLEHKDGHFLMRDPQAIVYLYSSDFKPQRFNTRCDDVQETFKINVIDALDFAGSLPMSAHFDDHSWDCDQAPATLSVNTDSGLPKENQRASLQPNPEIAEINFDLDPILLEGWTADIHPGKLYCLFTKESPYNLAQDLDVDQIQPVLQHKDGHSLMRDPQGRVYLYFDDFKPQRFNKRCYNLQEAFESNVIQALFFVGSLPMSAHFNDHSWDDEQAQATPSVYRDPSPLQETERAADSLQPNPEVAKIDFDLDPILLKGWEYGVPPMTIDCYFTKDSCYNMAQHLKVDQIQPIWEHKDGHILMRDPQAVVYLFSPEFLAQRFDQRGKDLQETFEMNVFDALDFAAGLPMTAHSWDHSWDYEQAPAPSVYRDPSLLQEIQRSVGSLRPNPEVVKINFDLQPSLLEGWSDVPPITINCYFREESCYNLADCLKVDQIQPVLEHKDGNLLMTDPQGYAYLYLLDFKNQRFNKRGDNLEETFRINVYDALDFAGGLPLAAYVDDHSWEHE